MATFPSTSMGDSTVAVNLSPDLLVFELMVWSRTTAIAVSAGMTSGLGSIAFFTAGLSAVCVGGGGPAASAGSGVEGVLTLCANSLNGRRRERIAGRMRLNELLHSTEIF